MTAKWTTLTSVSNDQLWHHVSQKQREQFLMLAASPEGSEQAVDVAYEPSKLRNVRAVLRVKSPVGGEYLCCLYGQCTPPQPQVVWNSFLLVINICSKGTN